ncbi:hypothetical protein GCM10011507_34530 [Edaphobacter acidisoli]|uniref:Peptidase S9 prolyl oligopeptidase catalytic domain-containing protein n=1 Tax=Edaphobacter acidisoli TaxID=2040573 RepID=A0A916WAD6_9BACT|nr:hypothetical protein [Edaphobacter acidisoli]GGA80380.1 hypothetical protein GCM10011507_34530 [Edaphobacter acidisoli]
MRLFSLRICLALCLAQLAVCAVAQSGPGKGRVTVADAIEMTRLGVASYEDDSATDAALYSPDGRWFAVVLKKGNLRRNTVDYTLEVFRTDDALAGRGPARVVKMSSSSNRAAIAGVKWLSDNRTLLFIGETPGRIGQIYAYDLSSRRFTQLTHHHTPVAAFDASSHGRVIVFEADPPVTDPLASPEVERNGFYVTGENLAEVMLAGSPYAKYRSRDSRQLFLMVNGRRAIRMPAEDGIWPNLTLSVAPNGRYALVEALVRDVPKSWLGYRDRFLHEFVAAKKAASATSSVEQYLLLDTRTGIFTPLIDAPKSWEHDGFLWLNGGRSLVLSKAYLPLAEVSGAELDERESKLYAIEMKLPSHTFEKILEGNAKATEWVASSKEVLFEQSNRAIEAYQQRGAGWDKVAGMTVNPERDRPRVTYEQDMNTPPKLWITNPVTSQRVLLQDLNPQFRHVCFGMEREISWKATDGHWVHGGLYLPPDYQPGQRYPLVIQTHGFDPSRFWIDGPWNSAFAARPLAARDIVVLQMGGASGDAQYRSTPEEAPQQMAAFEGAIDYLHGKGIIDRERVGIIGFSRTVYYVAYTLTHSKYSFRAATLADGFNAGYFMRVAYPNQAAEPDAVNGGPPYGTTLSNWIEHSPSFNILHVKTPIRLESYSVAGVMEEWEWYSLLSTMGKPVDLVVLPHGTHLLVKPWERMASEQGNVDWFTFWLKGEEDPAPDKRALYARWRKLRTMEADQK